MTKHAGKESGNSLVSALRMVDGQERGAVKKVMEGGERVLPVYDATVFVGLRTIVYDAAIERTEDGEVTIELPKPHKLVASAAVARCMMPVRLRGSEMRSMRKIMKLTLADLAKKLDEKTAAETVSRWESEAQPMGGYAEKLFRLIVCEELKKDAPGVDYSAGAIVHMKVCDPWRSDPNCEPPSVALALVQLKEQGSGSIIEAWNVKQAA
jgi:DNA-binding transcriptional regulator YiaG